MKGLYEDYLKSKQWQKKREEILNKRGKKCMICGCVEHIQVHHLNYESLADEDERFLIPICQQCHTMIHIICDEQKKHSEKIKQILEKHKKEIENEIINVFEDFTVNNLQLFKNIKNKYNFFNIVCMSLVKKEAFKIYLGAGRTFFDKVWAKMRKENKLIKIGYKPKKDKGY